MVKIFPFKGVIYNKKKIKNLSKAVCPPYDIISPEEQEEFYQQSDFNYIRLILGKEFGGDNEYNNRYMRAAAFLDGWLRHKIMLRDQKPAIYVYEQKFSVRGKKYARIGFVSLIRLEDGGKGKVYPHEETYPKAKLDRLLMMRATNANLDCVFSLYSDQKNKIMKVLKSFMKRKPIVECKDGAGFVNRLWRIDKKGAIAKIMAEMKDKPVFIADGHHRFEAAIRHKEEMKTRHAKFTEDEGYNHVMMFFTPLEDKGLVVLPIHRAVHNLAYFDPIRFEQDLGLFFDVTPYPAAKKTMSRVKKKLLVALQAAGTDKHAFAVYLGNCRFLLLVLRDPAVIEEMVAEEKPKAWKQLDVNVLHYAVFDRLLGIANETEDKITYFKEEDDAIKMVDEKGAAMAVLLNPTKIEEIVAVAGALEKMPHKSTYFYPKLTSGVILNRFENDEKIK